MICAYEFQEYFCLCGTFIFNSTDIIFKSTLNGRDFLFVPILHNQIETIQFKLVMQHSTLCTKCKRRVGAWLYRDGIKHCIRFHKHLIIEKKQGIFLLKEETIIREK